MFNPSKYSGSTFRDEARPNGVETCEKYKQNYDKYYKKMWETPVFTTERQTYEDKANSAMSNYRACKTAGGRTELETHERTATVRRTAVPLLAPTSTTPAADAASAAAEADAAAAAAAAAGAGGGTLPLVGFGAIALIVLAGGAYFVFGKKKKKKKIKVVVKPH